LIEQAESFGSLPYVLFYFLKPEGKTMSTLEQEQQNTDNLLHLLGFKPDELRNEDGSLRLDIIIVNLVDRGLNAVAEIVPSKDLVISGEFKPLDGFNNLPIGTQFFISPKLAYTEGMRIVEFESRSDDPIEEMDRIYKEYSKSFGKPAPDAEMAQIVRATRYAVYDWW
jgi:hypothetical protein